MFYIGIDIAKKNHEASIIDSSGKSLSKSISFPNSTKGIEKFNNFIAEFGVTTNNCIVGMEATGHYWISLFSYIVDLGFTCYVINPIQSDAFRKMYVRQTKNDSVDSFIIAQIMRFGEFSISNFSDENTFALRNLTRYRFALVDECSDWKRKLVAILDQVFPEYSSLFSNIYGVSSKELLSKYPLPEDMLSIPAEELGNLLYECSKGRLGINKAEEIQSRARETFGIKFAKRSFSFQIKQIISQISFLEEQLKEIEIEISYLLEDICPIITTITGIGSVLGASIVSEIGNISRFERANQLVAYAGLDTRIKQSGDFSATNTKLSKRGSPYLRRSIWLAATVAAFKDPALSIYYQGLRARGKAHGTAIGAVARKLTNIIFAVLRDQKPYTPNI
ncbi:MAG: IS110 family transposase [Peptostreptococcus sp.]|uniref:IS110 family transposase n=1 Tax=Peptostreptococcus sp. TaxID=1262 RepID=UPI001CB1DE5C|nr:IS110 family transposase [Peptostreptococcus sp.]MBF1043786.1 IS110 family transposase [Peptostreptococcus sp.]MBF1045173.1 IS110 family transposase [Peptostreptococcus sp.]